jgi:hypothetical protein
MAARRFSQPENTGKSRIQIGGYPQNRHILACRLSAYTPPHGDIYARPYMTAFM